MGGRGWGPQRSRIRLSRTAELPTWSQMSSNPPVLAQVMTAARSLRAMPSRRASGRTRTEPRLATPCSALPRTIPTSSPSRTATKTKIDSKSSRQSDSVHFEARSKVVPNAAGESRSAARRIRLNRSRSTEARWSMRIPNPIIRPDNKDLLSKAGGSWVLAQLGEADGIRHSACGSDLSALVPTGLSGLVLVRRAFAVGRALH